MALRMDPYNLKFVPDCFKDRRYVQRGSAQETMRPEVCS